MQVFACKYIGKHLLAQIFLKNFHRGEFDGHVDGWNKKSRKINVPSGFSLKWRIMAVDQFPNAFSLQIP
jgi:hypothetical protein